MGIPLRVLIVEDSVDDTELVLRQLRPAGYDLLFERVQTAEDMKAALEREAWELVVSDYSMPQFNAPAALNLLNQSGRDVPFIVVSGSIGEDIAVAMMKAGAHDYFLKDNLTRFIPAVQRELRNAENRRQQRLTEQAKQRLQIERNEFLERLKQENEDLAALTQVTTNAISTLELDELLQVLLTRMLEVMHADTATILLVDGAELGVRASVGAVNLSDSTHVKHVGECFAGTVASRMKPVYVEDAAVDPLITDPLIRERGIRSMLGVPLKRNGTLIGVLHVDWLTVRPCRDREVHLLEITAERSAAAIQNAQLYQEARHMAATLADRETHLRQLSSAIEQTADSVLITDREGTIQYVNTAFERNTGYRSAEVMGRKPNVLKSAQHTPEFYQRLWRTITAGQPFRAVFVNRRKDESLIYEEKTITPIKDDRGGITHFVSTAKDITDRKRAEAEQERLWVVLEAILNEIYIFDAQTLRFEYVNACARRNLGYSMDAMRTLTPLDLKPEFSEAAFDELIGPLRRHEKEQVVFQTVHRRADGSLYPVEVQLQLVERGGRAVFLAVINDITERKWTERQSASERRVLEMLALGAPLAEVLDRLARECEELCPGTKCSVLLLDADGRHLRHGAAPNLPAEYIAAIDGIEIGPRVGSCGTAAHTGRTVIVSDIATDPLWADFRELALSHGLRACWSVPILGEAGRVLGTFALYYEEQRAPKARELTVHEHAASLASLAILRHRTLESLRTSEERFRQLAQNIDEIFWMTDSAKTQMIYISPAYEKVWGRTCASVYESPRNWLDDVHPDDRERIEQSVFTKQAIGTYDEEYRIVRPDGTIRWIHDRAFAVRNDTGEVYRIAGVAQDITERKRAEQEIRALNQDLEQRVATRTADLAQANIRLLDASARIRSIVDTVVDGIIIIDERGIVETVNPAVERIFGYAAAELIGRNVKILMPDPYHSEHDGYLAHYRATGEARIIGIGRELVGRRKDGSTFPMELGVSEVRLDGERRFTGTVRDITARKAAEAQRDRFFNLPVDMFCIAGMDGYFKRLNPAFSATLGWTIDELLARPFLDFVHPDDRLATVAEMERLTSGQPTLDFANRYQCKDGSWRWLSWKVQPFPEEGLLYATARDVTDSRLAEDARQRLTLDIDQARREAEQANRAKSQFLATMSHEIRTPMNGVIGMIDVLHETSLRGFQVEMVDLIRESAYSLLAIIEDILDFSKIEAGKLEIDSAAVGIETVIKTTCGMLEHMAARKGVELTLYVDPEIPAALLGDSMRLRQILVNLTGNAIKFSSGGERQGRVSVRALLAEPGDERVVVEFHVADNGIGMSEAVVARLFTPFTQADATTTRQYGGTGLGLAIVKHLVNLMGGSISVASEPGRGSNLSVRIPMLRTQPGAEPDQEPSPVAGLSCVVVGGAKGISGDLAAYLAHAGAGVTRAEDLASARAAADTRPPSSTVWIVDAQGQALPPEELRAAARSDIGDSFVVIGRGQRRRPRAEAPDLVTIDGNALTRRTFLNTVALAAGRRTLDDTLTQHGKGESEFRPPERSQAARTGRLILVAEDNETNRQVLLRQLAVLGIAADFASDGREALERWESGSYALLLTDLHMPRMDGYDLARAIRLGEADRPRMPIIALTANALREEAEHCRAAGMDEYLSKPAPLSELKAVLEKWMPAADSAVPVEPGILAGMVGNDPDAMQGILGVFRANLPATAAALRDACAAGDTVHAGATAHKLKSSARSIGALRLGNLCAEMEKAGRAGGAEKLVELLPRFEAEVAAVQAHLDAGPGGQR